MRKKACAIVVMVLGVISMLAGEVGAAVPASQGTHKVWVCKYVGTPGVDERLKDGKQPISVDDESTVGTWFNDAQGRSFVLAIDDGEHVYTAADCPGVDPTTTTTEVSTSTSTDPTTSTTEATTSTPVPESTTTSVSSTTTSTSPPTTTVPIEPTTTTEVTTASVPTTTLPIPTPTTLVGPPTAVVAAPTTAPSVAPPPSTSPPVRRSLPFTGSHSDGWVALGLCLLAIGTSLLLDSQRRPRHR